MHMYRRFLFASSGDQAKVVLQSIKKKKKKKKNLLTFWYNRRVTDVALSLRSTDTLR
jgi:hypothetical protein